MFKTDKKVLLRTSALALLLLLAGDIESNPGPSCATCQGEFQSIRDRMMCEGCNKQTHSHCSFTIPDTDTTLCRSCFWVQVSQKVASNLKNIQVKCDCTQRLQEFEAKLNTSLKKFLDTVASTNHSKFDSNQSQVIAGGPAAAKQQQTTAHMHKATPRALRFGNNNKADGGRTPTSRRDAGGRARDAGSLRAHRYPPAMGLCKITQLRTSSAVPPPKVRERAIFLSRLDVQTTEDEIKDHLSKVLPSGVHAKVTKLAGKNTEYYSSFHISVPLEFFATIRDPMIWPEGAPCREYRGRLQQYRVYSEQMDSQVSDSKKRKFDELLHSQIQGSGSVSNV